jgi:ketosteroid isomerase-like protein
LEEPIVANSPQSEFDSDLSKIAAVREVWIAAVKGGDVDRLVSMVTDDVVGVFGNGRCVSGKEELKAAFMSGFGRFDMERRVVSAEVLLRDKWAFEIDEMEGKLTPIRGGTEIRAHLKTIVVFKRQSDASWKVARLLDLLD